MTLYLKYRPKDFESLVWQDFVKNTLKQAILKEKLVWAYLFCWPRGTGKTSSARIFAKAMNCTNLKNGNPCNECEICLSCNDESLVDIIEIDAASYTGVDNIRDIIERAQFSPTKAKYKVYIIDEVHMLSKGAFNALLKILEEPPSHLKFILATTEIHKVPETILSRCQRYDFKSITPNDLINRLLYIAKTENISIDEESLSFIVKQSNGGLRNAISLFEQLIVNDAIVFDQVVNNFWIPKTQVIESFYQNIFISKKDIITSFDELIASYNIHLFLKELLFFIKDKMIASLWNELDLNRNIFLLETLEETYSKMKSSFDAKTTLLVWILKCIKNISPQKQEVWTPHTPIKTIPVQKPVLVDTPFMEPAIQDNSISHEDLFDVFWDDAAPSFIPHQPSGIPSENEIGRVKNWWTIAFDLELLITQLKSLWSKWALTMSLRSSSVSFDGKILSIYTKTKISLKQILTADNLSLITQALEKMWLENVNIEVK